MTLHIKREDGPNAPGSGRVAKEPRNQGEEKTNKDVKNGEQPSKDGKSRKNTKSRRRANPRGTTDNRRASKNNHAVFETCECGSDQFMVDGKNTRTVDDMLAVLTAIVRVTEIKGKCMGCGAKAVGKLFKENAVDIDAGDSDTVKSSRDVKEYDEMLVLSKSRMRQL